jgi:serine/threonine protein kinase
MKECPQCRRCYPDRSLFCNEDGKTLLASLPGEPIIDGRYQLEQRLGQGSLGVVFKARHIDLRTAHAIKLLTPELAGNDPALAERFRQEVTAAAEVSHPNLAAVTDFGLSQNAIPFLVMELIEGPSLAELLSRDGRMRPYQALKVLSAIAAALAAAHKQGLAHGNLKPANIMMQEDSPIASLKLVDLGLANLRRKEWGATVGDQQAAFLNSALYRAPELWFEDKPDARSDVYSLAAVFFQMLTGVVPFKGDSIEEVRRKVLTQKIPLFDSLGIDVSPQLEGVVFAALTKDRDDRTPTIEEFMNDVHQAIPVETAEGSGSMPPSDEEETLNYSDNFTMDEPPSSSPVRRAEGYRRDNLSFDRPQRPDAEMQRREGRMKEWDRRIELDRLNVPPQGASANVPPPTTEPVSRPAPIVDENVQFTVFRPRAIEPEVPYSILIYAHLAERAPDAPANSPDPKAVVEQQAREVLGNAFQAYADTVEDSQQAIPRNGVLTFVPDFPGLAVAPPQLMLLWRGPVHQLEFSLTAGRELEGRTIRGNVRVYLGVILLAELNIAISVNTAKARQYANEPSAPDPMPTYRKIFASYSHRDEAIVQQFEQLVVAFGDEYLRDVRDIRAGEKWNARLQELIREADVFQLFWSKNSMKSQFVKDEWNYALSLNKLNFIRPTFWEEPMPEDKQSGLPPAALLELQFKRVPIYVPPSGLESMNDGLVSRELPSKALRTVEPTPAAPPDVPASPITPAPTMRSLPKSSSSPIVADPPLPAQTAPVIGRDKTFTIMTSSDRLKTDNKGHAEAAFIVTNTRTRPVRCVAMATALDSTKREWLKIIGEAERDFAAGDTQQYVVMVDLPTAPATPTDKYGFRLNVASVTNPDEDFAIGPIIRVTVPGPQPVPKNAFPKWIFIPIAAGIVLLLLFFLRLFI